jgi:hypothetical protein
LAALQVPLAPLKRQRASLPAHPQIMSWGAPQRRPLPPPPWSEQSLLHEPHRCVVALTFVSQPSSFKGEIGVAQLPKPGLQVDVHWPLLHAREATLAPEQTRPQPPQLFTSLVLVVSHPSSAAGAAGREQLLDPELQPDTHTPPLQARALTPVEAQARPHAPQLSTLVVSSVSQPFVTSPSQSPVVPGQLPMLQRPAVQAGVPVGVVHTLPHAPQFCGSVATGVSQPSSAAGDTGCRQSPRESQTA